MARINLLLDYSKESVMSVISEREKILRGAFAAALLSTSVFAASPTIKVDLDISGRKSGEVTEPNWIPWAIPEVNSKDTTISGVKFTLTKGSVGKSLRTAWNKVNVQSPVNAKLVGDGVQVEEGNAGGEITLKIENLETGKHSILIYSNLCSNSTSFSNLDVYLNGSKTISNYKPAVLPTSTAAASSMYINFDATKGKATTLLFKPNSSNAAYRNVTLNAFALNVPNVAAQSSAPSPTDGDDQTAHNSGSVSLSWKAASSAKKHQVYFGTDSNSVAKAGVKSIEYRGEVIEAKYALDKLSPLNIYYWRIDEVDASGTVTKGDVWRFRIGRIAFDGAEGYGRMAVGGRGGKVVYVTNLNDSGPGSLRAAIENESGPRTIMFKVGGVIPLKSRLVLSDSYVTIAGQTAPGKGITITKSPIGFTGHNLVVRYLRARIGYGQTYDGMGLTGGNHSILDHASISWTIDEGFSSRGSRNVTLQHTMIAEALNIADHQNYPSGSGHGFAATVSGRIGSYHHNLLAHNNGRNWSIGDPIDGNGNWASQIDIFNNVVYNYGSRATDGEVHQLNFVNNYYKKGPATTIKDILRIDIKGFGSGTEQGYYHGNIIANQNGTFAKDSNDNKTGASYTVESGVANPNYSVFVNKPFFPSYAKIHTAVGAFKDVLSDVGCNMPLLDDHDKRIIKETKNGTTTYTGSVGKLKGIIDREKDVGGLENYPTTSWPDNYDSDLDGLPDWWENMYGYNPKSKSGDFSESNKDRLGDGWTELERYLEWMARAHYTFAKGETQVIDLAQFTKGYDGGTYTVSAPTGVTATVSGSKMTVKLADNFGGVGYIKFTLKDKEGDTFTRNIGVTQMLAAASSNSGEPTSSSSESSSSETQVSSSSDTPASSSSAGNGSAVVPSADGVYQAEDGTMTNALFEDKNAGFNGTGYVNFAGEGESIVEIPVSVAAAGTYTVTLRYSLGKDETRELSMTTAQTAAQTVAFTSTGAWTTWETKDVAVELPAGESKITIATVSGDGPNLDQIALVGEGTSGMTVAKAAQPFGMTVTDNIVMLTGIPEETNITVLDVSGHSIMMQKNVVQTRGMATVNMQPYGCGIYLVNIRGKLADGKKMNKTVKVMRK